MVFEGEGVAPCVDGQERGMHSMERNKSIRRPSGYFPFEDRESREQRMRILVVDDDPVIRGLVDEMLGELKYCVMGAANGQEGLSLIQENPFDGILLDLDMPIMDGRTMLDELRWQDDDTPVVGLKPMTILKRSFGQKINPGSLDLVILIEAGSVAAKGKKKIA